MHVDHIKRGILTKQAKKYDDKRESRLIHLDNTDELVSLGAARPCVTMCHPLFFLPVEIKSKLTMITASEYLAYRQI